jgi:hypothetical protein
VTSFVIDSYIMDILPESLQDTSGGTADDNFYSQSIKQSSLLRTLRRRIALCLSMSTNSWASFHLTLPTP